ncbi:CaiB/BaiF CoA transferase family protein [Pseudomonas auratipiscis]|uniref:CaiB/BaiF CoA-transferase family protein n=1 Tax=Pseudomonas auratipiscis TaxID=3115853 RepID=A0AB35WM59_9PSED|nr:MULTISPECIES: CaiB/BaiF CoA-transferase family protein [unclassified Pseudomonas]MEE1865035.1 CaiB/BaiF CoA-transferase family protein [Pseudomonas sp. 120P]MEE1956024.1 CaiB/BaiF CoA-transferase family protein [Pseudomonas sp. 119P]
MSGPLAGLKVVEMAGLGPAPFCAMMLADMGAEVIRIEKPVKAEATDNSRVQVLNRGRRSLAIDMRAEGATDTVLELIAKADILIEGFRPGVMERMGLGPDVCLARNPRLVYGRMTGWGQFGPLAHAAGHDINYIAIAGALHAIGRAGEKPVVPLNYVGDFGGGGMLLGYGVLCALTEARSSGKGQVVDAAMTDGTALLSAMMYGFKAAGAWNNERGDNLLDGGAHFYDTYRCADGKFIAIGAIEPQFYSLLLKLCNITDPAFHTQRDKSAWAPLKERMSELFMTQTRQQWCALLEGTDACFAPVLDWDEAAEHPHNIERETFIRVDGVLQPAPAPRFSRSVPTTPTAPRPSGADSEAILADWGIEIERIEALKAQRII